MYISYVYKFLYTRSPFLLLALSNEISFLFLLSSTLPFYRIQLLLLLPNKYENWERERRCEMCSYAEECFYVEFFYVPLRCCYLLRSALCIRFKHCVQLDLYPVLPYIYSDIEKYIVISYLLIFHIMKENDV